MTSTSVSNPLAGTKPPRRIPGDGDPMCPRCWGGGTIPKVFTDEERRKLPPYVIPELISEPCACTAAKREAKLLERAWRGLSAAEALDKSPLGGYAKVDVWLRVSSTELLLRHVRRMLIDSPELLRSASVVSDAGLLDAETAGWGRRDDEGGDDAEPESGERSERATDGRRASDMYLPPGLLVIIVGMSSKKHSYLAMLVEDAVRRRASHGRPTWVVDEAARPLARGHRTYSDELERLMGGHQRVVLDDAGARSVEAWPAPAALAPAQAVELAPPDKIDDALAAALVAAGRPAGLPRHPAGGAATDCDDCGGAGTRSIFCGRRGDLLCKCHAAGCPSGGKVAPLGARRAAPAAPAGKPGGVVEVECVVDEAAPAQAGPQVQRAVAWLREQLARGPRPWPLLEADGRDAGLSRATLYRARALVGISSGGPVSERVVRATSSTTAESAERDISDLINSL